MNYPLISEYIEAIKAAEDNFKELTNLRPVHGDDGQPVMTSGNFAVVFKMQDIETGKLYALKCFTKEQEGREEAYHQIADALKGVDSPYLVSLRYFDKELFVDTEQTADTEFPVLLMDWVEGKTLDKYLRENLDDKYVLEMLAYRFSLLAQWLIPQPFAHGDLKPDNILVREDGTLVLVDYDGMYVPPMKGQKARELGSPDFRHPLRTENDFDEHIDDFSLVSILLSLKVVSKTPLFLEQYRAIGRLLFSEYDYMHFDQCEILKCIFPSIDNDVNLLVGQLITLLACNNAILFRKSLVKLTPPAINTEDPNLYHGNWIVDDGIRYTPDYKYVLGVHGREMELDYLPYDISNIHNDSLIICDNAFDLNSDNNKLWIDYDIHNRPSVYIREMEVPSKIIAIGNYAFSNIHEPNYPHYITIKLNEGLISIGDGAFAGSDLKTMNIPKSVSVIGDGIFSFCRNMKYINLPDTIETIPPRMFQYCESLESVRLPEYLKAIGCEAFQGCHSLEDVFIPKGVRCIDDKAFEECKKLKTIYLPDSVREIGEEPFFGCESLMSIVVPKGTKWMFEKLLPNDKDIIIEIDSERQDINTEVSKADLNNVWTDEYGVIYSSDKTRLLKAPTKQIKRGNHNWTKSILSGTYSVRPGTQCICDKAFLNCCDLSTVILPQSVKKIGARSFQGCLGLSTIELDDGLVIIGDNAFRDCKGLHSIHLPRSLKQVGNNAFYGCRINVSLSNSES